MAQALSLILTSEFDDDVLLGLSVVAVEPGPNESQLLVTLHHDGTEPVAVTEILRRLANAAGFLRSQVAAAITRKRAPQLVYCVVSSSRNFQLEVEPSRAFSSLADLGVSE